MSYSDTRVSDTLTPTITPMWNYTPDGTVPNGATSDTLTPTISVSNFAYYYGYYSGVPSPYLWIQPGGWAAGGSSWTDFSGNNKNLTSSAAMVSAGTLNGYTVASLGTSQLTTSSINVPMTGGVTGVWVFQGTSATNDIQYPLMMTLAQANYTGPGWTSTSAIMVGGDPYPDFDWQFNNASYGALVTTPSVSGSTAPWIILISRWNPSTSGFYNSWYGASNTGGSAQNLWPGYTLPTFTAAQLALGWFEGASVEASNINLAEFALHNVSLTDTQVATLASALKTKYALT